MTLCKQTPAAGAGGRACSELLVPVPSLLQGGNLPWGLREATDT